jgi:hypothetical protein
MDQFKKERSHWSRRTNNLAEVVLDNGKSEMHATTDLQAFGLIITAEPYFAVTQPSDLVVAQNIIRSDTKGREEAIDVRCELLPKGLYASQVEPLRDVVYGIDQKAPLDLFEARNAVRIARAAKAEQYAPSSFAKAAQHLKQAEDYYRRKQGRTPIGTVAREAVQTAEEARIMSLKRQEERVKKEKQAAAAREAHANAEAEAQTQRRMQAETERASAEHSKAEAERAKQESVLAAQKAAQKKQEAQAAQAAALAQQQALQAENERARLQAEEAERGRQKAEAEKSQMRGRLLQQLNAILVTRDTARGLVRDYLAQQGIPISSLVVIGFGKTQPVASNTTTEGRQQNRRVELVVSGEVIGTKIGGDSSAISTQPQP